MLLYGTVQNNEAQLTITLRTKVRPGGLFFFLQQNVQQCPFISLYLPVCGMFNSQIGQLDVSIPKKLVY
jgi:hypothetical protein